MQYTVCSVITPQGVWEKGRIDRRAVRCFYDLSFHVSLLTNTGRDMFVHTALLLLAAGVAGVVAPVPPRARIVGREATLDASYDFVIIGGGTSGLTVADRLTENPDSVWLKPPTAAKQTQKG
jgi:hypothetical protein